MGGGLEANQPRPQTTGSRKQSPGSVHRLAEPPPPPTPIQQDLSQVDGVGVHRPVKCFLLEN